jgi:hypothetical protein
MDILGKNTINNTRPYAGLTDNYDLISTREILEVFGADGWVPSDYRERKVRVESRIGTQSHCVVLSNPSYDGGSTAPRIMVKNSHDGTSSLRLLSGLFERICANGLVVGASAEDIRIRHLSLAEETIRAGIQQVTRSLDRAMGMAEKMKSVTLDKEQQLDFAQKVIDAVWDEDTYKVLPAGLLWNHRQEQRVPTLWNTFNTVQERIIRGGVRQYRANGTTISSRAVKSIDRSISLNQTMWDCAEAVCATC